MKHTNIARIVAAACGLLVITATQAAPPAMQAPAPGRPATWMPHDMIVSLSDLPRSYSCDDLWYKFHDLLLALGARPDMKILTYSCGRGAAGLSPQVHLQFSLPQLLTPAQARWMDVDAAPRDLRLGPGNPRSWKRADCELMRQVKDELLAPVTQRVVSFDLACAVPPSRKWGYGITVRAVEPVSTAARVASIAPAGPRPLER